MNIKAIGIILLSFLLLSCDNENADKKISKPADIQIKETGPVDKTVFEEKKSKDDIEFTTGPKTVDVQIKEVGPDNSTTPKTETKKITITDQNITTKTSKPTNTQSTSVTNPTYTAPEKTTTENTNVVTQYGNEAKSYGISNPYSIKYNGIEVKALIDIPKNYNSDVILSFNGTTKDDSVIFQAAEVMLNRTRKIISNKSSGIISIAYPQEGLLMGDNVKAAEAALLWLKTSASKELGINIKNIYMFGHSQGGYVVTILNTKHTTNGVIANGPGPIDLVARCNMEETGIIKKGAVCNLLNAEYGSTSSNSKAYLDRSLISYTTGHKSKILFIQGMADKKIQLEGWEKFKDKMFLCKDCNGYTFEEIPGAPHEAVFSTTEGQSLINEFIGY